MGGLFSSEPEKRDVIRTPNNYMLDREIDGLFRENNQETTSSVSSYYGVRSSENSVGIRNTDYFIKSNDYSVGIRSNDYSVGIRSNDYSVGVRSNDYSVGIRSNDYSLGIKNGFTKNIDNFHRINGSKHTGNVNINNSHSTTCSFGNTNPVCTVPATSHTARAIKSKTDFERFQQILFSAVIRQCITFKWNVTTNKDYQLIPLQSGQPEYEEIFKKFSRGIQGNIVVHEIRRIENPYLLGQFFLKKLEYVNKCLPVEVRILFHGTKYEHIDSICKENFDWRLHGSTKGNIFGKGVSFTPKSSYANHYCDRKGEKVMIVAKVLISKTCAGNEHMTIPNYYDKQRLLRYDTSIKQPKKDVLVKYCDDEFYPAYLIYYTGKMFYPNKGFSR